jgi:hypothetical protein
MTDLPPGDMDRDSIWVVGIVGLKDERRLRLDIDAIGALSTRNSSQRLLVVALADDTDVNAATERDWG